jgi:Tat protein translocase TatB subunit
VFNVGGAELLVILLVALLVLGPNKLPDAARQVGRALGELRRMSSGFQAEMRDALREPVDGAPTSASSAGGTLSSPRSSGTPATPSSPATGDSVGPAAQPEDAAPAGAGGEDGDDRPATAEGASPASGSGDDAGDDAGEGGADGGAEGAPAAPAAGGGTVTTPPARDPGANGTTPA